MTTARAIEALEKIDIILHSHESPKTILRILQLQIREALATLRAAPDAEGMAQALEPFAREVGRFGNESDETHVAMAINNRKAVAGLELSVEDYRRARRELSAWKAAREGGE